jgi:hypothetical protein
MRGRQLPALARLCFDISVRGFNQPFDLCLALGTLEEAVGRINGMPAKPSFTIYAATSSHLSRVSEFDDADRIISQTRLVSLYVPGRPLRSAKHRMRELPGHKIFSNPGNKSRPCPIKQPKAQLVLPRGGSVMPQTKRGHAGFASRGDQA